MMHRNDFVVSIQPVPGSKAYREYKIDGFVDNSHSRVRQINIQFNQEYQFIFKNMKNVRRAVTVEIDGSEIGSWVVGSGSKKHPHTVNLERFMDSDKRFKVLGLGDGGVDDPDNPNNGLVKITVVDEDAPRYRNDLYSVVKGSYIGGASADNSINYSCDTIPLSAKSTGLRASNVATGEGSKSNQSFRSTRWNGDHGDPFYFEYRFIGIRKPVKSTNNSLKLFCCDCGSKLSKDANFCHSCGAQVAVYI